jgi:hypothetical protein
MASLAVNRVRIRSDLVTLPWIRSGFVACGQIDRVVRETSSSLQLRLTYTNTSLDDRIREPTTGTAADRESFKGTCVFACFLRVFACLFFMKKK